MSTQILKRENEQKYSYELYSFDVFDTLLARTTAIPVGIFTIVQKKLQEDLKYSEIPEIVRNNFFTIRRESESFVRENNWCLYRNQDIKFSDIYDNIKQNYALTNSQIEILKQLEIETELKNLVPIPQNINKIKELILNGKKVILISDMYHEEKTIKLFLSHIDPVFNGIKIYVSSEYNKTKASTALYRYIQSIEKVPFEKWCHCGDNMRADVNQARALKMGAVHFPFPALKPYENSHLFKAYLCEEDFYSQMIIGCARLTRLLSQDKSPIYQFGCSFAGPILYNYVSWILQQTETRNIKNLYFVARDGYVLKLIADEIIKVKNIAINTKYIYGSRAAWRIPNEKSVVQFLAGIFDEYKHIFSLDFLSTRLFMDVNELRSFAEIKDSSEILDNDKINNLYKNLVNNPNFINRILEINKAKQELLMEYLEQEIDFSEDTIAFVDLYGSGRTQDLLAEIINSKYDKNILSLYFHSAQNSDFSKSEKINYFSTIQFKHFSIELLCRNIDGQTLGYKKENGKIIPIFDEINSQKLLDWGYQNYIQGLKDYAKNASMIELINNYSINSYNVQKRYIKYYLNELDKDTADIFGSIPYLAVGSEKYIVECAREFNQQDYKNMLLNGNRDFCNVFDFISFKRSDVKFRKLFEFNKKHFSMKRLILSPLNKIFSLRNDEQKTHKILIVFGLEFKFLRQRKVKYNFIENIFSIKNDERGTHKILCFLGLKLKLSKKRNKKYTLIEQLFSIKKSENKKYKVLTMLGLHIKLRKFVPNKILLISQELSYSGSPHSLLRICKVLKKYNYDIEVWSLQDGDFKREFEKFNIITKIVTKEDFSKNEIVDKVREFDLAICNTVLTDYPYSIVKDLVTTVWYIREAQNLPFFASNTSFRENLLRKSNDLYCVSEYAQKFIKKYYKTKAKVVHNCVEDFADGSKKEYFKNGKINFLILGTIEPRKGMDVAISAIKNLPPEIKEKVTLTFAGRKINSPFFTKYYNQILSSIENEDNIKYIGEIKNIDEKINIYKSSDVVIIPSTDESCSLVALEGIMMSCPIIVTKNVGAKYVVNKNTGWVFETGNTQELASIMKYIVENKKIIPKMGLSAREEYLKTSNMNIYEKNIIKLIKENI